MRITFGFDTTLISLARKKPLRVVALAIGIFFFVPGSGAEEHQPSHHSHGDVDHSHHMKMMENKESYRVTRLDSGIPDTRLVGTDNKVTSLHNVLNTKDGVMINFIFTSCTSICPTMSAVFSGANHMLGAKDIPVRMISISIDPEYDTPERLRNYAARFGADKNWLFFTGELTTIINLQKKLGVFRGNKMNHFPATFIRPGQNGKWVRLDGFASAGDLTNEYIKLAHLN